MKEYLKSPFFVGIYQPGFLLRNAMMLVWGILLCARVCASPFLIETSASHLSKEVYVPLCLPSERTSHRMELRKSNSWRESWYGDAMGQETLRLGSETVFQQGGRSATWSFSVSGLSAGGDACVPGQRSFSNAVGRKSDNPFTQMYYYRGYAPAITAVGATSVAAMAAPAGDSPIQKISGRQRTDEWLNENPNDPGERSNESPVGDQMILLLLALAWTVYCKTHRQTLSKKYITL